MLHTNQPTHCYTHLNPSILNWSIFVLLGNGDGATLEITHTPDLNNTPLFKAEMYDWCWRATPHKASVWTSLASPTPTPYGVIEVQPRGRFVWINTTQHTHTYQITKKYGLTKRPFSQSCLILSFFKLLNSRIPKGSIKNPPKSVWKSTILRWNVVTNFSHKCY